MKNVRCQARTPGHCRDPRCPEKNHLKEIFDKALLDEDYQTMFAVKEEMDRFKPIGVYPASNAEEWDQLVLSDDTTNEQITVGITPEKTSHQYDLKTVPSFSSYSDIQKFFTQDPNVVLLLGATLYNSPVAGHTVKEFYVSPGLRGQGVGGWIMDILTKHADDNNSMLFLTPTSAGDKKIDTRHPQYETKALAHRERLTRFYQKNGFRQNPFWIPIGWKDELTQKPWQLDEQEMSKFTSQGKTYLGSPQTPQLVRLPHGKWPESFQK